MKHMKTLLPLVLLALLASSVFYFINTETTQTSSDADMLQLGDFAFQNQRYKDAIQWYTKAASQGKGEAQFQLSVIYERGLGVEKNDILALHWMKRSANSGLSKAAFNYANMLALGRGLPSPQPEEAIVWYEKAAKAMQPEAMLKLATLYFNSDKTEKIHQALSWSLKAQNIPVTKKDATLLTEKIITAILERARNNDAQSQYKIATVYQTGSGLNKDGDKARYWLLQSAQQGYLDAQYALGKSLSESQDSWGDARLWLEKAAKQGHSQAGYALAALLSAQPQSLKENKEAWRWLYHGLRSADPKTLYNLAIILHNGNLHLPIDDKYFPTWLSYAANNKIISAQNDAAVYYVLKREQTKQSLQWLEDAATAGDSKAQFNLGLLYARGEDFNPSDEKAVYWWKMAEQSGNTKAVMMLGLFYNLGRGVGRNEKDAITWYEKAAELGDTDALFNLAIIYYDGQGVNQSFKKAAYYLKTLAQKNDSQAQNLYAYLLLEGKGVTYSPQKAIEWLKRAAHAGNILAMFNLATEYRSGNGVAQDDKKALSWYQKAAAENFAPAQNALGYMYAEGRGVKKDTDKAEEWFFKASDNGLRLAEKNLDALRHQGSFSLVTLQTKTNIRSQALTDKKLNLSDWLEIHHQPVP